MEKIWSSRFTALIIDGLIITLIMWVLSALIYPLIGKSDAFYILNYWFILTAIVIISYFTYLEGNSGTTPGKDVMKIKVISNEGKMRYKKTFIRNLSKILWIPLILDVLVGFVVGNSKIRYLDKIAGTDVVRVETHEKEAESSTGTGNAPMDRLKEVKKEAESSTEHTDIAEVKTEEKRENESLIGTESTDTTRIGTEEEKEN